MKVLLLGLLSVLGSNVSAVECSVNELVKTPMNIALPQKYELCLMNQNNRAIRCAGQNELNYSPIDIQAQAKKTCGFKGSELQVEAERAMGTVISCEDGAGVKAQKLEGLCLNTVSKDGKFMLKLCTDLNQQIVVTLAIPTDQKDASKGYLMVNPVGNGHVSHVNEVTCGENRVQSPLSKRPIIRDRSKEQGI